MNRAVILEPYTNLATNRNIIKRIVFVIPISEGIYYRRCILKYRVSMSDRN